MADKTQPLTDHEWARQVGCDDQATGKIGLFTLLRLVADQYRTGSTCVFEDSTLLTCLKEADPTMKHWHLMPGPSPGLLTIWRRKEFNESIEKQAIDAKKKAVSLITQAEYNQAKEIVMEFLMLMCDNDKRAAEKMFYAQGLANDQQKLIEKAAKFSQSKARHAADEVQRTDPNLASKVQALRLKLQGK